jgi:hypothetical protein
MRRCGLLALAAPLPGAGVAQPHRLAGRWEGKATASIGREGPGRVLLVRSVAPGGKA